MSFLADRMFKSGWMRLWAVATCSLLVAAVVASAVYVWAAPFAYTFVTVNIADDAVPHDRKLAESVKQEATTKIFTGDIQYSPVLTLEDLAKQRIIRVTSAHAHWPIHVFELDLDAGDPVRCLGGDADRDSHKRLRVGPLLRQDNSGEEEGAEGDSESWHHFFFTLIINDLKLISSSLTRSQCRLITAGG